MKNLMVIILVLALLVVFGTQWSSNSATIEAARAAQESAQAAQAAAQAAQIGAAGLATVATLDAVGRLLPWVLLIVVSGVATWLYFRKPARQVTIRPRNVVDVLPAERAERRLEAGDPLEQLIKLQMLEMLERRQQRSSQVDDTQRIERW